MTSPDQLVLQTATESLKDVVAEIKPLLSIKKTNEYEVLLKIAKIEGIILFMEGQINDN